MGATTDTQPRRDMGDDVDLGAGARARGHQPSAWPIFDGLGQRPACPDLAAGNPGDRPEIIALEPDVAVALDRGQIGGVVVGFGLARAI